MKYTLKQKKPINKQVIVFKVKKSKLPEIGICQEIDEVVTEIYIPSNDDSESLENIEWWMEIPE